MSTIVKLMLMSRILTISYVRVVFSSSSRISIYARIMSDEDCHKIREPKEKLERMPDPKVCKHGLSNIIKCMMDNLLTA